MKALQIWRHTQNPQPTRENTSYIIILVFPLTAEGIFPILFKVQIFFFFLP